MLGYADQAAEYSRQAVAAKGAQAAGAEVTRVTTNEERLVLERYRRFDAAAFGMLDYWKSIAGGLGVFLGAPGPVFLASLFFL